MTALRVKRKLDKERLLQVSVPTDWFLFISMSEFSFSCSDLEFYFVFAVMESQILQKYNITQVS